MNSQEQVRLSLMPEQAVVELKRQLEDQKLSPKLRLVFQKVLRVVKGLKRVRRQKAKEKSLKAAKKQQARVRAKSQRQMKILMGAISTTARARRSRNSRRSIR
jgi:hypothetical protein